MLVKLEYEKNHSKYILFFHLYFKSLSSTLESDYQNFKKISDFVNKQNDLGIETLNELNAVISKLERTEEVFFKYYKDELAKVESRLQNEELDSIFLMP